MTLNNNSTPTPESDLFINGSNHAPPHWADGRATITIKEAAKACGVSCKTIRRWIQFEGLPVVCRAAAGVRQIMLIIPNDLDAWLKTSRHDSAATNAVPTVKIDRIRFLRQKDLDIDTNSRSSVPRHQRRIDQ